MSLWQGLMAKTVGYDRDESPVPTRGATLGRLVAERFGVKHEVVAIDWVISRSPKPQQRHGGSMYSQATASPALVHSFG